jgi:hypothetical protein
MVQRPNEYHYKRRLVDALRPDIRNDVLEKGFTPEFSTLDDIVKAAVDIDDAQCYHSGYNSLKQKTIKVTDSAKNHSNTTTQASDGSNPLIGTTNQNRTDNNTVLRTLKAGSPSRGGGKVAGNSATKNPVHNKDSYPTKTPQGIPNRNAPITSNTITCFNCNQIGHIRPNCPYLDKDRGIAAARMYEETHSEGHVDATD